MKKANQTEAPLGYRQQNEARPEEDPGDWAAVLGFELDEAQRAILDPNIRRGILNCSFGVQSIYQNCPE